MDARTFGGFVAACRREKGMTQAELAEKLHVTDKAVSRWERGVGFPNIATLEPLAAALEVSVLELMKSERIEAAHLGQEEAAGVVLDTLDVAKDQRQRERRNVLALLGGVAVADLVILLLDNLKWQGGALFIWGAGVAFPLFCLSGALALLGMGVWQLVNGRPWRRSILISAGLLLLLILLFASILLAGTRLTPWHEKQRPGIPFFQRGGGRDAVLLYR